MFYDSFPVTGPLTLAQNTKADALWAEADAFLANIESPCNDGEDDLNLAELGLWLECTTDSRTLPSLCLTVTALGLKV